MNTTITDALNYYDENYKTNKKIFENYYYYNLIYKMNDMEKNIIVFYNENKKFIKEYTFELLGISSNGKLWNWGWSIVNKDIYKNMTYKIRDVLIYGIDLDPTDNNLFLKKELITSSFQIEDPIQLDIHIAVTSYLTKIPLIYPLLINMSKTYENDKYYKKIEYFTDETIKNFEIHYLFLFDDVIKK